MGILSTALFLAFFSRATIASSPTHDTITPTSLLRDGETLVSGKGNYALGFFSPTNSDPRRYLAIWYHTIPSHDVVWIANARAPVPDLSGTLSLSPNGSLLIHHGLNSTLLRFSPLAFAPSSPGLPVAQLLDSGNFVVKSSNNITLWQSFDYPSNTILPGMFIGWDKRRGLSCNITSWTTPMDPTPGPYTTAVPVAGVPEIMTTQGHAIHWRGRPWIGNRYTGYPEFLANGVINLVLLSNHEMIGYYFESVGGVIARFTANPDGTFQLLKWADTPGRWNVFRKSPAVQCDVYGICGPFGVCDTESTPVCGCLRGFRPRDPDRWALQDWSGGCVRNTAMDCRNVKGRNESGDGFVVVAGVKLPDTTEAVASAELGLDECRERCLTNCSCTAYSFWDFTSDGRGCIMWMGDLKDVKTDSLNGQQLNLRVAASDAVSEESGLGKKKQIIAVAILLVLASIIFFCSGLYLWRKKRKKWQLFTPCLPVVDLESKRKDMELPLFDMDTIENATKNFSDENQLGQGGFGPVYKGQLEDGQEIAVKRLSRNSCQGMNEFMNEVVLIAKLQHRNLVRLLGCCIQGDERLLIYEYMPNKSLDSFIFDQANSNQLNWQKRFEIIMGIARGLLYLHQDSPLKVIHRDLKVSNILLDQEMNPKISDFGLARIAKGDQTQEMTEKVVGTYGYMSPEYAMHGIFSVKSDVFSFGVIVLEIITGKKNRLFDPNENQLNLLGLVWNLWTESRSLELVDDALLGEFSENEVRRCMQVGLLCVQEGSEYRPTMASAVLMLVSEGMALPQPKKPGFYPREDTTVRGLSMSPGFSTVGQITLTVVDGR